MLQTFSIRHRRVCLEVGSQQPYHDNDDLSSILLPSYYCCCCRCCYYIIVIIDSYFVFVQRKPNPKNLNPPATRTDGGEAEPYFTNCPDITRVINQKPASWNWTTWVLFVLFKTSYRTIRWYYIRTSGDMRLRVCLSPFVIGTFMRYSSAPEPWKHHEIAHENEFNVVVVKQFYYL